MNYFVSCAKIRGNQIIFISPRLLIFHDHNFKTIAHRKLTIFQIEIDFIYTFKVLKTVNAWTDSILSLKAIDLFHLFESEKESSI